MDRLRRFVVMNVDPKRYPVSADLMEQLRSILIEPAVDGATVDEVLTALTAAIIRLETRTLSADRTLEYIDRLAEGLERMSNYVLQLNDAVAGVANGVVAVARVNDQVINVVRKLPAVHARATQPPSGRRLGKLLDAVTNALTTR